MVSGGLVSGDWRFGEWSTQKLQLSRLSHRNIPNIPQEYRVETRIQTLLARHGKLVHDRIGPKTTDTKSVKPNYLIKFHHYK